MEFGRRLRIDCSQRIGINGSAVQIPDPLNVPTPVYRVQWEPLHRIITLITPGVLFFSPAVALAGQTGESSKEVKRHFFPLRLPLEPFSCLAVNLNRCCVLLPRSITLFFWVFLFFFPLDSCCFKSLLIFFTHQIQIHLSVTAEEWI